MGGRSAVSNAAPFPGSAFDFSVVAGLREPAGDIERLLTSAAGNDLVEIEFVRVYTGAPFPEDRKSVSYRLTLPRQTARYRPTKWPAFAIESSK